MIQTDSREYHHGNLKQEILEVALRLLDEQGISGVGIRSVAREIGVTHAAPANHFKNKKVLMTSLATEIFSVIADRLDRDLCQVEPGLACSLKVFGRCLLDYGLSYPNRYQVIWQTELLDMSDQSLIEAMDRIYDVLLVLLKEASSNPHFDDNTYAISTWSMIHGYIALRLNGSLEPRVDALSLQPRLEAMIDLLCEGMSS